MKKFILIQYGFETPTPEIMEAWGKWFGSIGDKMLESVGPFGPGKEISHSGTKDLPMGLDSLTGFSIIQAENMNEAVKIAQACPIITSVGVHEIKSM